MTDAFGMLLADLLVPFSTPRGVLMAVLSAVGLALVFAGTFARNMVPLRSFTFLSQVAFIASAFLAPNIVAVVAYALLIPLNGWRLLEIVRLTRRVRSAPKGDVSGLWLKQYMRPRRLPAGHVLFRQGDPADELYLLVSGDLRFEEAGVRQPEGEIFGEIAFFAPDRRRTLTAVCHSECHIMGIEEPTFHQLYYQSPELAFRISSLIATRLSADVARMRHLLAAAQGHRPAAGPSTVAQAA